MRNRLFELEQEIARVRKNSQSKSSDLLDQQQSVFSEEFAARSQLTEMFHYQKTNISLFIDSLFEQEDRLTKMQGKINEAVKNNNTEAWLIEPGELKIILNCWQNAWNKTLNDKGYFPNQIDKEKLELWNKCHPRDNELMAYLCAYVNDNKLSMWEPKIELQPPQQPQQPQQPQHQQAPPKYFLKSYQKRELYSQGQNNWLINVDRFLTLLAAGAHFVVIHSPKDTQGQAKVPPAFYSNFKLPYRWAFYNSHYAEVYDLSAFGAGKPPISAGNFTSGMIYPPEITKDEAPNSCPFIASLLIGRTAWNIPILGGNHNSFFQLEGWPQTMWSHSSRHGKDYEVHNATKWNISTYGACPYSEKRGTTIFLAADWTPQTNPTTIMAPYVGAETPQSWLDKTLIQRKLGA